MPAFAVSATRRLRVSSTKATISSSVMSSRMLRSVYKHTLLFNFSTWVLEYVLTVHVASRKLEEDMQLLQPSTKYTPRVLEQEPTLQARHK